VNGSRTKKKKNDYETERTKNIKEHNIGKILEKLWKLMNEYKTK
jgi:hypothetical protein